MLSTTSCSKDKDIKVSRTKVESFQLKGLRSMNLDISVTVDNPKGKIEILDLDGQLNHNGKVLGNITVSPFVLMPRRTSDVDLKLSFTLASDVSLKSVLSIFRIKDMRLIAKMGFTLDLQVTLKIAGIKTKRDIKNIPIDKLLDSISL